MVQTYNGKSAAMSTLAIGGADFGEFARAARSLTGDIASDTENLGHVQVAAARNAEEGAGARVVLPGLEGGGGSSEGAEKRDDGDLVEEHFG